jgi:hypothetical protein
VTDHGKLGLCSASGDGLAKDSDKRGKPASLRADAVLKAAVRRIESERVPETLEDHARRISGAPSAKGDKRN